MRQVVHRHPVEPELRRAVAEAAKLVQNGRLARRIAGQLAFQLRERRLGPVDPARADAVKKRTDGVYQTKFHPAPCSTVRAGRGVRI